MRESLERSRVVAVGPHLNWKSPTWKCSHRFVWQPFAFPIGIEKITGQDPEWQLLVFHNFSYLSLRSGRLEVSRRDTQNGDCSVLVLLVRPTQVEGSEDFKVSSLCSIMLRDWTIRVPIVSKLSDNMLVAPIAGKFCNSLSLWRVCHICAISHIFELLIINQHLIKHIKLLFWPCF